jgi:outer membrane protein insertion porin family
MPGQPFSFDAVQRDQKEIEAYYGDRAYIFAKVNTKPEWEMQGHDVHVRFDIEEANEIFIEEIKIRGNEKTQDRVVRRELEFYPGERVDLSKLTKSRSNLNRLQFFKSVDYTFENGSSPSQKHLVVNIEEETAGRLMLGFGVTSGFGIIGNFRIIKQNFDFLDWPDSFYDIPESFTGAGQTLDLRAEPGTQRSLYRFSFTEPYIFNTRNALTLSASRLTILRNDYDEDRSTFSPRLAHAFDFDRDLVLALSYRIEEVEISDLEADAPADAFAVRGFTTVSAASVGLRHDKVLYEYMEGAYEGVANVLSFEYGGGALGGDVDFYKPEVANEFYYPLYTSGRGPAALHHVVSIVNRFGIIEPHSGADPIPIFERVFLGGANTVRGFDFRGLGPHDGNDPIGGTAWLWGNVEYSFPILLRFLRGVVFFDYANLSEDIDSFDFSEMRYSVGGGLRLTFPLPGNPIPIGLYLGFPIKKEDEDETKTFSFTIGVPF